MLCAMKWHLRPANGWQNRAARHCRIPNHRSGSLARHARARQAVQTARVLLGILSFGAAFGTLSATFGQTDPKQLTAVLAEQIVSPEVSRFQLRQYLLNRVSQPPAPASAPEWTREAGRLRQHLLNDVVFHGWPRDIVDAAPRFEERGVIDTGKGYRIRKLRYEIVPGFYSAALLYEPENAKAGSPAILNVNGHVGAPGKSVEYKQKRCIQFAKHGIFALNLEWLSFGELAQKENQHWFGAHLDLVGRNELGLFYLEMRRGLDYLASHPLVDRNRLGMTGLSGGGWQTIVLSALDERVRVSVPVAGFSTLAARIEANAHGDLGDVEQSATDFLAGSDFSHLVALRAPRPTLLIYNAQDDCCFRSGLVKPGVFDAILPIFKLYDAGDALRWYENFDPGTHNYQKDNRLQAYQFFSRQFNLPAFAEEGDLQPEVRSFEDLTVGLPQDNLSILGLARKLGREISRPPVPADAAQRRPWMDQQRAQLAQVLRYQPARLVRPWGIASTKTPALDATAYLFEMNNGVCANGVLVRVAACPDDAPVTLVLNDQGKKQAAEEVAARANQGEQVLALDLLFTGDAWQKVPVSAYEQMVDGVGERSLGLIAAQLIEVGQWARNRSTANRLRLETTGLRSQVAALAASALRPDLFSEIVVHKGAHSLQYILDKPVEFSQAPEIFCLDLLKHFDLDRLETLAEGTRVNTASTLE
jgi:dienelactone hydrolase